MFRTAIGKERFIATAYRPPADAGDTRTVLIARCVRDFSGAGLPREPPRIGAGGPYAPLAASGLSGTAVAVAVAVADVAVVPPLDGAAVGMLAAAEGGGPPRWP